MKYDCCNLRHVLCNLKRRRLTKTPAAIAADEPITENYGKDGKIVMGL